MGLYIPICHHTAVEKTLCFVLCVPLKAQTILVLFVLTVACHV